VIAMPKFKHLWIMVLPALSLYGCPGKPPLEPPPSLVGSYTGTYARTILGQPDSIEASQYIIWTFTDTQYYMDYDTSHYADVSAASICDCGGIYAVTSGILLQAETSLDSNRTGRICEKDYAPDGQYLLDQSVAGQITMTSLSQTGGMSVLKTIHLVKK
jgi:hypothetical protein